MNLPFLFLLSALLVLPYCSSHDKDEVDSGSHHHKDGDDSGSHHHKDGDDSGSHHHKDEDDSGSRHHKHEDDSGSRHHKHEDDSGSSSSSSSEEDCCHKHDCDDDSSNSYGSEDNTCKKCLPANVSCPFPCDSEMMCVREYDTNGYAINRCGRMCIMKCYNAKDVNNFCRAAGYS